MGRYDYLGEVRELLDLTFSRSPETSARLCSLVGETSFNWDALLHCAIDTFLAPGLPFELKSKHVWDRVPAEFQDPLECIADLNRRRNQDVLSTVKNVSRVFQRNAVEAVFLKGAACLLAGVYGDYARRFLIDVDVLVPRAQFRSSVESLLDAGYRYADEDLLPDDPLIGRHYPPLLSPFGDIAVEVHRCLGNLNVLLNPEDVLESARESVLDGVRIRIPANSHLIAHHALHAQEYWRDRLWPRPHQIADLGILAAAWEQTIDWPRLIHQMEWTGQDARPAATSSAAIELLRDVRNGKGPFSTVATARNPHERLLRSFPRLRFADPWYVNDMWMGEKWRRAWRRMRDHRSATWAFRRLMSRTFWNRTAATFRSI